MAHGHVAHVLLGSGNAAPPLGAAALAVSLVARAPRRGGPRSRATPRVAREPCRARARRAASRRWRSPKGAGGRADRGLGTSSGAGSSRRRSVNGHQHRRPRHVVVPVDRVPGRAHGDRADEEHAQHDRDRHARSARRASRSRASSPSVWISSSPLPCFVARPRAARCIAMTYLRTKPFSGRGARGPRPLSAAWRPCRTSPSAPRPRA